MALQENTTVPQKTHIQDINDRSYMLQVETIPNLVCDEDLKIYNETIPAGSTLKITREEKAEKRRNYQNSEDRKRKRREWENKPENIEKRKKYNERQDVKDRQKKYYQEPTVKERRKENAKFHREWKKCLGDLMRDGKLYHKKGDTVYEPIPQNPKDFLKIFFPENISECKPEDLSKLYIKENVTVQ